MPTLYLYMSCSALLRFLSRTIFLNSEILASASKSRYRCLNGVIGRHGVSVGSVTLRSHRIFSPLQFADCRQEMAVRRSLSSSSGRGRRLQKHSEGRTPKGFARSHSTANWRGRERSRSFQRNTVCVWEALPVPAVPRETLHCLLHCPCDGFEDLIWKRREGNG